MDKYVKNQIKALRGFLYAETFSLGHFNFFSFVCMLLLLITKYHEFKSSFKMIGNFPNCYFTYFLYIICIKVHSYQDLCHLILLLPRKYLCGIFSILAYTQPVIHFYIEQLHQDIWLSVAHLARILSCINLVL